MLETLKHGDFAGQLHTNFRLVETDEPMQLELIEISEPRSGGGQEFFSLVFLGDKDRVLPQKLYRLEHENLGRGQIFLVPIGTDDAGAKYEAVFNRLTNE